MGIFKYPYADFEHDFLIAYSLPRVRVVVITKEHAFVQA